jgi:hypothetical protein
VKIGSFVVSGMAVLTWIGSKMRAVPISDDASSPAPLKTFTLRVDVPDFGIRRGEQFVVCPDDPIHIGDVVALKSESGGIVLARYRDDFIGYVAGRIRRANSVG